MRFRGRYLTETSPDKGRTKWPTTSTTTAKHALAHGSAIDAAPRFPPGRDATPPANGAMPSTTAQVNDSAATGGSTRARPMRQLEISKGTKSPLCVRNRPNEQDAHNDERPRRHRRRIPRLRAGQSDSGYCPPATAATSPPLMMVGRSPASPGTSARQSCETATTAALFMSSATGYSQGEVRRRLPGGAVWPPPTRVDSAATDLHWAK